MTGKKYDKIYYWLKKRQNLYLLGILLFAFAIRIYYFILTKGQTLWWDEAEYMSIAKNWALGVPYDINPQRPILFPFLALISYTFGLGEASIKFIWVLIPSILIVLFTYLLIKEMYNEKIALVSSFIMSVFWMIIFYSMRVMTDAMGFLFGILSFYLFWKGYVKKEKPIYIWLIGFFIGLSFLSRLTGIFFGVSILLYLLITERFSFLKNKNLWISLIVGILTISPLFIWDHIAYGNSLAFKSGYSGVPDTPIGWNMLNFIYSYTELIFFVFLLIGLVTLISLFIKMDIILKKKEHNPDLFLLINLVFTLIFFIFMIRYGENRWLIAMSISLFAFSAKGILWTYKSIKKNFNKKLAIIILLLILTSGAYFQIKHADNIIKVKIPSYSPVKEAGVWLNKNSNPEDLILSLSLPQITYYSEREVNTYSLLNVNQLKEFIKEKNPRFLVFSPIFEANFLNPETITWIQKNPEELNPIYAIFADESEQQAIMVIYEITSNKKTSSDSSE